MGTDYVIILVVVLLLLFGGGGGYYWSRRSRGKDSLSCRRFLRQDSCCGSWAWGLLPEAAFRLLFRPLILPREIPMKAFAIATVCFALCLLGSSQAGEKKDNKAKIIGFWEVVKSEDAPPDPPSSLRKTET